MIRASIVGGTGYTGVELLRLLAQHPHVEVSTITSRAEAGLPVAELFPSLRGHYTLCFSAPEVERLADADVVFFATPHGVAQNMVPEILARGVRVIDLSADFRLRDRLVWERWYGQSHGCPELLDQAVYGLPELNRAQIAEASLIACPGCYPTSVQLGLIPLLEAGVVAADTLIASSASGVSGAGRQAKIDNLHTEVSDSFKAYGVRGHRHLPEMMQSLEQVAGAEVGLTFVPHLLPTVRGIHSTLFARCTDLEADLQRIFEQRYAEEPFVDVLPPGACPQTRSVRGSNLCRLAVTVPTDSDQVVVMSVIDNLVKGAAGQAVQNMNIAFGWPETTGLDFPALMP